MSTMEHQLPALTELKLRLAKIEDLKRAKAVLEWDERVMMPPGGGSVRGEQIASLERARHERFISDEIGNLLEQVKPLEADLPSHSDDAVLIRIARREFEKEILVPPGLSARIALAGSQAEQTWREARRRSDFTLLLPQLNEVLDLKRQYIACFDAPHPYDPLLDEFEPGMKTGTMTELLAQLKAELISLSSALPASDEVDDSCLYGHFPIEHQRALARGILELLPLPPGTWRIDETVHPFATAFATTDLRITTRYSEEFVGTSLFSALHEFGHALYDNGVDPAFERSFLGEPDSLGLHESQSRLWENMVGRSRPFWRWFYPRVQSTFPDQLGRVDMAQFHRAVNKVQPSLIRTEADELTYDLHVILRFELEQEILQERLELHDLPQAWNARIHDYLDLEVTSDAEGVLQDVHWAEGAFGYFPTYSLGNIIRGQLWEAALAALPGLYEQIERGEFGPLREWLRENVHRHGRKLTSREVVEQVTGGPIEVEPYLRYLRERVDEVYGVTVKSRTER